MPNSPNLGIIHLDPAQNNKAATVNEQLDAIDVAIAGTVSVNVAGSANVTLTTTPDGGQAENAIILLTGVLTGNIELIFPNITRRWHIVNNTTGAYTVTCIGTSGTGVVVTQGAECDIRWDPGSGNMAIASSGGGGMLAKGVAVVTAGAWNVAVVLSPAVDYTVITAILSWNTSVWFTANTSGGFTLNFATQCPAGGGSVMWGVA